MTNNFRQPSCLCWQFPYIGYSNDLSYPVLLFLIPMEYMTSILFRKEADPVSTDGKLLGDLFLFTNLTMWPGLLKVILILMFQK